MRYIYTLHENETGTTYIYYSSYITSVDFFFDYIGSHNIDCKRYILKCSTYASTETAMDVIDDMVSNKGYIPISRIDDFCGLMVYCD